MQISNYKYTDNWPFAFTNEFFNYLNFAVGGEQLFFEHKKAIMPIIFKKKYFFKIGYCIHPPVNEGKKISLIEEKHFFEELTLYLKNNNLVDFILPPNHIENFHHIPSSAIGCKLGIIRLQLKNQTEESVFSSFKPIYRNLIRKAIKEGVEIKFGLEYFDDFYKIYHNKLLLEGAPIDTYEQIKMIASSFNKTGRAICGVAYFNNKAEAAIFNINDNTNASYMWSGTTKNCHAGALRLLQWKFIQYYLNAGIENYNMGGARNAEQLTDKHKRLLTLKKGFGATIIEGYHFTLIIHNFKYQLYKKLLSLKNKLSKQ